MGLLGLMQLNKTRLDKILMMICFRILGYLNSLKSLKLLKFFWLLWLVARIRTEILFDSSIFNGDRGGALKNKDFLFGRL